MSAIIGVLDTAHHGDAVVRSMLVSQSHRGADRTDAWSSEGATLAVARHEWELGPGFAGPVLLAESDGVVVAADATLYYRDELAHKLGARGIRASQATPAHLILAAYRAWGTRCAAELEGDFAFVLYDVAQARLLAARDFTGKRPLYYAELSGGGIAVASTIAALVAHPRCSPTLDRTRIGLDAAGLLFASGDDTCYERVHVVPAGSSLVREGTSPHRIAAHWVAPTFEGDKPSSLDEGAEELRALLARATAERLATRGTTAVWMSGGFDSSAVFAAGRHAIAGDAGGRSLHPVSISYPVGDPGREDELIAAAADRWKSPVRWLDIGEIDMLEGSAERAARRDEPFAHIYEQWNRALARGARSVGARVALDGNGGDQSFQLSRGYLSDLLVGGRWLALARAWRAEGGPAEGIRAFLAGVVHPTLPEGVQRSIARMRGGRRVRSTLECAIPRWIRPEFARANDLAARAGGAPDTRGRGRFARGESRFYFTTPYYPRVFGIVSGIALESGIELRSPLLDGRVVAFAASRPRSERRSNGETKRLLRASMRGLLPDAFLARRTTHTGTVDGYLQRSLLAGFAAMLGPMLETPLVLDAMGIVDVAQLRRSAGAFFRSGDSALGAALLFTTHAELWLRAKLGERSLGGTVDEPIMTHARLAS